MSVKRLSPRIVEDTDPPFAPVAVMRYDNDGLYVLVSEYAALLARHNALREAAAKMLAADGKDCWDAREYLVARAEVDRLLMEEK